jgi:hypothetical protein
VGLALITPSFLLSPRAVEQRAVAAVYHALAADLRAIGTPAIVAARRNVTAALNAAYDALLTVRSSASGRNKRDMHLMAILNVSHQMAGAATALRTAGERPPPWVTETIGRLDLLSPGDWRLAQDRLVDTLVACVIVLLFGYAPWPVAWQAHLPGQFAETLRAVAGYMDESLVTAWAAGILSGAPSAAVPDAAPTAMPGAAPARRSRLRRQAYRSLSDLRAEFQRTMSEPPAVSRRASAWWPAVVGLEEVMDAVTSTVVAISHGGPTPAPDAVHQLTGTLRAVADAIEADLAPSSGGSLPADADLQPVTAAVRSVLAVLTPGTPVTPEATPPRPLG